MDTVVVLAIGHIDNHQPSSKGNCSNLSGQVFHCSNYKQADTFVNTLKRISQYVSAEYKHEGGI
jgi:hypothetical protein